MNFFFQNTDFKPHKLDDRFPLVERFAGDSIICMSLFSHEIQYSICSVRQGSIFVDVPTSRIKFEDLDELQEIFEQIKQKHGTIYCSCSIEEGFEVMLLHKSLKNEPNSRPTEYSPFVLGSVFEKDREYLHISNQNSEKTLLFSFSRHHINQLTNTINKGSFILAQLGCGAFNLLRYHACGAKNTERNLGALLIMIRKCVVLLKIEGNDWKEVSFRYVADDAAAISTANALIERLEINGNIGYHSLLDEDCSNQLQNHSSHVTFINLASETEDLEWIHNFRS